VNISKWLEQWSKRTPSWCSYNKTIKLNKFINMLSSIFHINVISCLILILYFLLFYSKFLNGIDLLPSFDWLFSVKKDKRQIVICVFFLHLIPRLSSQLDRKQKILFIVFLVPYSIKCFRWNEFRRWGTIRLRSIHSMSYIFMDYMA
jgi:hypothetical protein